MTIQALAAGRTERGTENLIVAALATPPDKRTWQPLENGRSVADLLVECTLVNLKWAASLRNRVYTRVTSETEACVISAPDDTNLLIERLRASTSELIAAIKNVRDDELPQMLPTPFGTYSMADLCLIAYWNSVYHEGQINYIQTLYGDKTLHTSF